MKKWIDLMNTLGWKDAGNWNHMDKKFVQEEIPAVGTWVVQNLHLLSQHPQEKMALKKFFWPADGEENMAPYEYILKDRAVCALAALYSKEKECDCS